VKLSEISFRDLPEQAQKDYEILGWWEDHIWVDKGNKRYIKEKLKVENGEMTYGGETLYMDCEELKYPIHSVKTIDFNGGFLKSLKFLDTGTIGRIAAGGEAITKIDHPVKCTDLSLARNKIESLHNIHKFVTCETIGIWNNPIKDSILGLLLIPGIKRIDDGRNGILHSSFKTANKAIVIVSKYAGKGKAAVLDAQKELEDAGLEDYAQL